MKNWKLKKLIVICLCVLPLFWILFHFVLCKLIGVDTQQAQFSTLKDTIDTVGVVVRDEFVIEGPRTDTKNLKYLLSDGEKIAKNDVLAEVYSTPNEAETSYKIDEINNEIEILEHLNSSRYNISKGVNFINNEINDSIKNLLISLGDSKILASSKYKKKLIYLLSEKQIIMGPDINLSERIENLKAEKNKLLTLAQKSTSSIIVPESGDFISSTDGYEKIIDYKTVPISRFENFDFESISSNNLKNNTLGKIVKSETWYAVCQINSQDAQKIHVNQEAKINVPSSDFAFNLPCKIESVSKRSNSEEYIMVISCDYMNKELALMRKENFKVNLGEYSGLRVKKSAIHNYSSENGVFKSGVYVKSGGYLKFKQVNPIFVQSSEVICSYNSEQALGEKYLQPGDCIIVSGTDLYENKKLV